ncbi:MAG: hypothetical protein ACO1Q7_14775 [Gemmatimonas sp.]
MPERHPDNPRRLRTVKSSFSFLVAIASAVIAAACVDQIDGGGACPTLCPTQPNLFQDTVLYPVELDTTISGFPTLGLSQSILLANRPDTVESYGVIRFDVLPSAFTPNGSGDTATITTVDSVFLRLVVDSSGARGAAQVELQAYDVDTTDANASSAVVRSLFRADRLIGSTPITTVAARDTIRIPISKAVLQKKLADRSRLRIGIKLGGLSSAQLRIVQSSFGFASPLLAFDPSTDTTYIPQGVSPNTTTGGASSEELLAASVSALLVKSPTQSLPQTLSIGGLPGQRSYIRFNIPQAILDSSTVVRAELILTQRPFRSVDAGDSIAVVPLINVSSNLVTDIRRAMEFAAPGVLVAGANNPPLDSLVTIPSDSGIKTINIRGVVNQWATLPDNVYHALVLRSSNEGAQAAETRFYSMEAPLALRPRIRITYLPRVNRALP